MHTFLSCSPSVTLIVLSSISSATGTPVHHKRYDLDHNGVPDLCYIDKVGDAHCELDNGSWTSFATATYQASVPSTTTTPASTTSSPLPTGTLPDPATFQSQNGTQWTIEYVGNLNYTGDLQTDGLGGDKCRTSSLGGKVIWSCGDMECNPSTGCGFSMGPAFYGTDEVGTVDTTGITNVGDNTFAQAWSGDPTPVVPQTAFGMDTSNVAAINDTTGVAYVWEIWRGAPDNSIVNLGAGVVAVTLGDSMPIATRLGPLLSGPDAIQVGLLAILRDGDYIYSYSIGGKSGIIVGRVAASDDVFDAGNYQFLQYNSDATATPDWLSVSAIPSSSSDSQYGMQTSDGSFGCGVYGSIFYSNYFNKYMLVCNIYEHFTNFYVANNAWGPWSGQYQFLNSWTGYGSMAHPEFAPGGSDKELYFSQGPDGPFNMFKATFNYD